MSSDRHERLAAVLGVPTERVRRSYRRPLNLGLPQVRQIPTGREAAATGSVLLAPILGFSILIGVVAGILTEIKLPIRVQVIVSPGDGADRGPGAKAPEPEKKEPNLKKVDPDAPPPPSKRDDKPD